VPKVIRVDLFQSLGPNVRIRDRIFFQYAGAGATVSDEAILAATIANAWATNLSPLVNVNHSLFAVQITDLTSLTGAQSLTTVSKAGTNAGSSVPLGAAAIVKFRIARRYRGGHPRFYLVGVAATSLQTQSTWTTAFQSSLATGFGAFITASEATPPVSIGALTHVNVSYFFGFTNKTFPSMRIHPVPTLRGTPLVDPVVSYSANPIVGSQRRRNQQSA
jgi:hypothetical protein